MRTPSKLLPNIDYTIEGGKIILSESFLLRRGFCCNTKCRHCPYKGERASAPIVILGLPKSPLSGLMPASPPADPETKKTG